VYTAGPAGAGVGAVAEQAVVARDTVGIGRRAIVGRLVARLRAVAVAVRAGRVWVHADWFPYSDGDLTAAEASRLADLLRAAAATATRQARPEIER